MSLLARVYVPSIFNLLDRSFSVEQEGSSFFLTCSKFPGIKARAEEVYGKGFLFTARAFSDTYHMVSQAFAIPYDEWEKEYTCSNCGETFWSSVDMEDAPFCSDECASEEGFYPCYECGTYTLLEDMIECHGNSYCLACVDRLGIVQCQHCTDFYFVNETCSEYCPDCNAGQDKTYLLHPYSYKPESIFHSLPKINSNTLLFFGIENEFSFSVPSERNSALQDVEEPLGNESLFYLKEDCSLTNGVEVVSHPFTLEFLHENRGEFKTIFDCFFSSYPSCLNSDGLHIHMSRAAFIDLEHQFKFTLFMNAIADTDTIVDNITRRYTNTYCEPISTDTSIDFFKVSAMVHDRYLIVNRQNRDTLEVRFFKSVESMEDLYVAVEFCHAVFTFSYMHSMRHLWYDFDTVWQEFVSYIHTVPEYEHLAQAI